MSDLLALTLGIVFFVVWVCVIIYAEALRRAYMMGRTDFISKKNRLIDYHGLAGVLYRRGRLYEAKKRHRQLSGHLGHTA